MSSKLKNEAEPKKVPVTVMQERARKTKARILSSAIKLFSNSGLNGATIDEIANDAGVNKQRIYAYFGSKNKLFEAALLDVFERVELFSQKTVASAAENPANITKIVVNGFLKVHASHPDLWRLLAWANLEGAQYTNALNRVRKKENEQLRSLCENAVAEGLLQPVKFEVWLFTLLAVTCFRYSNKLTLSHTMDWKPTREFETALAEELNMLFAGRK